MIIRIPTHLTQTFPALSQVSNMALQDIKGFRATLEVLDILLNARASGDDLRSVASAWSCFANEQKNLGTTRDTFKRVVEVEPEWEAAKSARIRFAAHFGFKEDLSSSSSSIPKDCQGMIHVINQEWEQAMTYFEAQHDFINLAATKEFVNNSGQEDENMVKEAWNKAISMYPKHLSALCGAKQYDQALKEAESKEENSIPTAEVNARHAQALNGLAGKLVEEKMAVMAEGLYRTSMDILEKKCVQPTGKPIYSLQLALVMGDYAKLLKDWEKREKEGEVLLDKKAKLINDYDTQCLLPKSVAFDFGDFTIST